MFLFPGIRARELCAASARSVKEAEEGKENAITGELSVEAVAAHTAQTSGQTGLSGTASAIGLQSAIKESRRATNFVGAKGSQVSKNQQAAQPSPPASPPTAEQPPRRLSVSASVAGEDGMYSCILPEDLLVEILAERMQVSCLRTPKYSANDVTISLLRRRTGTRLFHIWKLGRRLYHIW